MNKRIFATLAVSLLLSGCAQLGGTYFKKSYVSIKNTDTKETEGTLFIWEADTSAAVLFKEGRACMQTALAVKTANIEAQTKLSNAISNLSKTALQATTPIGQTIDKEALLEVTGSIQEAAQLFGLGLGEKLLPTYVGLAFYSPLIWLNTLIFIALIVLRKVNKWDRHSLKSSRK